MNQYIPVLAILIPVAMQYVLSRFTWKHLADNFAASEEPDGGRIRWASAVINGINYNSTLILRYNGRGLYIKQILLFRLFHKPVFIPWKDMEIIYRQSDLYFGNAVLLKIGGDKITNIKISRSNFDTIYPKSESEPSSY